MECLCLCSSTSLPSTLPFRNTVINLNGHNIPSNIKNPKIFSPYLSTPPKYTVNCRETTGGEAPLSSTSAYAFLGVEPDCSAAELKAAFRAKVRLFTSYWNKFMVQICVFFFFLNGFVCQEKKKKKKEKGSYKKTGEIYVC